MLKVKHKSVPCSVGILTYNSEKNLRRALESVKEFSNIIISDGGSTDSTLEIAKEYDCTIIDQYSKINPGPVDFHPIEDFALERNRMLAVAKEDWYLWIDSDEYISRQLHDEIAEVVTSSKPHYYAYKIPIAVQSPDAKVTYYRDKTTYQIRFFNLKTGGKFERAIHERFVFDKVRYPTGQLNGKWYVPFSKPDFENYRRVVKYRLNKMISENPPSTLIALIRRGVFKPLKNICVSLYRCLATQVIYFGRSPMPIYYYLFQVYSHLITSAVVFKLYFVKFSRKYIDASVTQKKP